MPEDLALSPAVAVFLVFVAVACGHLYRKNWISEGPRHLYWIYGVLAAASLLALALIPLRW